MEENLFKYGSYDLDKNLLLKTLLYEDNLKNFSRHMGYDNNQDLEFRKSVKHLYDGISNGTLSGDGFGNFKDTADLLPVYDDFYRAALTYVHENANAIRNYKKNIPSTLNDNSMLKFNINEHGFDNYILNELAPFAKTKDDYANAINLYTKSYENNTDLSLDLLKKIESYQKKYNNFIDLDFSDYGLTSQLYNEDLELLKKGLLDGSFDVSDKTLANKLGLTILSLLYQNYTQQPNDVTEIDDKKDQANNIEITDKKTPELNTERLWGDNTSAISYAKNILNTPWLIEGIKKSDKLRIAALVSDIGSLINIEPISATGMGLVSDYLNLKADEMDGINDSYWDDIGNFGLSILGAVPFVGDIGIGYKALKTLKKVAVPLIKSIGPALAVSGLMNSDEIFKTFLKLGDNEPITVNDLRNIYTGLTLIMGIGNASRSRLGKKQSTKILNEAPSAIQVKMKNKQGTVKTVNVVDDIENLNKLKKLQNNPEKFLKHLTSTYLDLNGYSIENIKTKNLLKLDYKNKILKVLPNIKTKTINEVNLNEGKFISDFPSKKSWARTRGFVQNNALPTADVVVKRNSNINSPKPKIKPDTKSEITNLKSDIQNSLKNKNFEELRYKFGTIKTDKTKAMNVKLGKTSPTSEFMLLEEALVQSKKYTKKEAHEALLKAGYYQKGGIIKAQTGIKLPPIDYSKYEGWDKYIDLIEGEYFIKPDINESELINWANDNNLSYSRKTNTSYGNYLRKPDTTDYSNAKSIYNSDEDRNNAIINYYNSNTYNNINDFIAHYNTNIDDFQNTADITSNDIKIDVSKDKNLSNLLNGKSLYKDKSGRLYTKEDKIYIVPIATANELGNNLISNIDNNKKYAIDKLPSKLEITNNDNILLDSNLKEFTPVNFSKVRNVESELLQKNPVDNQKNELNGSILLPNFKNKKFTEEPKKPFFPDLSYLTSTLLYLNTLDFNKNLFSLRNELEPLHYDPKEDNRFVYGDLNSIIQGKQQAADLIRKAYIPFTSDAKLLLANIMDAYKQGYEFIKQGQLYDNITLKDNIEKALLQNIENHENRYNVAMKNRENDSQVNKEKLLAKAHYLRANYESTKGFVDYINSKLNQTQSYMSKVKNNYYDYYLKKHIKDNPEKYIEGWNTTHLNIYDKGISGETLTQEELKIFNKLKSLLEEVYIGKLASLYGINSNNLNASDIRLEYKPQVPSVKKGGNINKRWMLYLKESNKNYNSAINRSIRGLYNHLKLQKQK